MATLGKSKKRPQYSWRPDFRNLENLPDTKVIRTGFLLNFVGICLAAAFMILYGYKEMELQSRAKSVNELESQVAASTSSDRKFLDTNKKFMQNAQIATEVVAFDEEPIRFSQFLSEIGNSVQTGTVLSKISMQHSGDIPGKSGLPPFDIQLMGKVYENVDITPAQVLSDFQQAIKEMSSLSGKELEMEMVRFSRNNELGNFDFTLLIRIPVEKAPTL